MNFSKFFNTTKLGYILFGIVFLTSGLIINLIQFLLYVVLTPINKPLFRKINYYIGYSLFSQIVFLLQYWANLKVILNVHRDDYAKYFGKEHGFLIMNHTYEIDWMIGWVLCDHCRLLGNCKTIAKKSLQYLPTLGFAWRISGSIFVERNWQKDQKILQSKLKELVAYTDPIWLLLAAEGTRFTKEKHEASMAFAREHGLPELRHHLTPRTKGFTFALPHIRNKIPAIYNVNVAIKPDGVEPTLKSILHGKSITAEFFVDRIPMEDLPEAESELADWLHNLYKRKDDLIHSYLTSGKWIEDSDARTYERIPLPKRIFPAVNFAFWAVAILIPLSYFFLKLLTSGSITQLASACVIVCSFMFLLGKLVGETKISKASSYGISKESAVKESETPTEN